MFNTKTIKHLKRIERILLNETVDRCVRTTKFVVGGSAVVYASWHGLDFVRCGAGMTACFIFAALSTLLGLTAFSILSSSDEPEGG